MRRSSPSSADHRRSAFTLIELLVVIGIIVLLVGLLLPVARKVRISGQTVATQSTINRLVQGCEAYYTEFHAYPGPFKDDASSDAQVVTSDSVDIATAPIVLDPSVTPPITLQYITDPTTGATAVLDKRPTSSENLFLGLCGGLRIKVAADGTTQFLYDPEMARKGPGPIGLNTSVVKKSQGFIDITDADISVDSGRNPLNDSSVPSSLWWPSASGAAVSGTGMLFKGDSRIFEFVDRFSSPRPILYMRARRGASRVGTFGPTNRTGFIYDKASTNDTSSWQYNPSQIECAYANVTVPPRDTMSGPNAVWSPDVIDYPDYADPNSPGDVMAMKGNERYFVNTSLSTGDAKTNGYTLVPQNKDKFILISAGPDGIYGTADDIRN